MADTEPFVTYRLTSGDPIMGEFSFMTSLDGWTEDLDEATEIVEEVWVLKSSRIFTLPTCAECDEPATYWGLCETHARIDDPESFAEMSDDG